jgi:hypothetical protein
VDRFWNRRGLQTSDTFRLDADCWLRQYLRRCGTLGPATCLTRQRLHSADVHVGQLQCRRNVRMHTSSATAIQTRSLDRHACCSGAATASQRIKPEISHQLYRAAMRDTNIHLISSIQYPGVSPALLCCSINVLFMVNEGLRLRF